ncbi:F-box/WD repeat-containing protein pof1 [Morella rubra]|uniref:F-box/WD repeat-containing protein pof1 n=1 Tax=Morella rubra TaxID=262757 RepID=A0A6A1UK14_9ROSI|nr:F-box/WD repeat-containing protein pof1 [Morella rubra]
MESPECPVCLESYDGACAIPRVLACGHTACEACLANLPQRFPQTVRCPACNQLVKYPAQGPSALPKNIDLLRLCNAQTTGPKSGIEINEHSSNYNEHHQFLPRFWSDEFYSLWKDCILSKDSVFVEPDAEAEDEEEDKVLCAVLGGGTALPSSLPVRPGFKENQRASLVRLVSLPSVSESSVFNYSYVAHIMRCLSGMEEEERNELGLILRASLERQRGNCKVYGLWSDLEGRFLYLVCEKQRGSLLEKFDVSTNGLDVGDGEGPSKNGMSSFALIGVEICEAVIALHLEGLVMGSMDLSCFSFDDFGHVHVDFTGVVVAGRKVRRSVVEAVSGRSRINMDCLGLVFYSLLKREAFLSPELLLELLRKEGIAVECGSSSYAVSCNSDVWSLACVLMRLIIGKSFTEQILEISVEGSDYSTWYLSWVKKVSFLLEAILGSEYASSSQLLCKCLNLDPGSRPLAIDVRRCVRELLIKPQFDASGSLEDVKVESTWRCLILGKLCQLPNRRAEIQIEVGEADLDRVDKNFVEGVSEGVIKFKDLQGHLDCITGLAVGGGFLFSSSFDKTIHVWSLQDFSHVNTFRGHEHRVMALVYVDDEQLCISADSGGGIFVWSSSFPLGQEPLKKWYEQKDWRYTGIHALTFFSGNGNLYTGSGDKAIKVWSVKNGTLSCTMDGHKSVVSTLAVHDGVLYSGSWDGTIRLWSLNDHSPLAVLGEDVLGNVTSVLSLAADRHMLVAAHENGCIKVWRNDELMKTTQVHNGAIFTTGMEGKWLFTGGWDKIVKVQELLGDEFQIDVIPTGSVPSGSVVTALLYWQGKLIVGHADRSIKVCHIL